MITTEKTTKRRMTPAELDECAKAYVRNMPTGVVDGHVKFDESQPHLYDEAVMVELLSQSIVVVDDLPERHRTAFFDYFDKGVVSQEEFRIFYNQLI